MRGQFFDERRRALTCERAPILKSSTARHKRPFVAERNRSHPAGQRNATHVAHTRAGLGKVHAREASAPHADKTRPHPARFLSSLFHRRFLSSTTIARRRHGQRARDDGSTLATRRRRLRDVRSRTRHRELNSAMAVATLGARLTVRGRGGTSSGEAPRCSASRSPRRLSGNVETSPTAVVYRYIFVGNVLPCRCGSRP